MAKVKIQGNASGTGILTVTAPNTSTDRTITLPDEDVTLGAATPSIDDNGNATAITINATENIGVGVTPESWEDNYSALQIGGEGCLAGHSSGSVYVAENVYRNGGNWKHINTGASTIYQAYDGNHVFKVEPSGSADANISWSTKATIDSDGLKFNGDTAASNALDDYEEGTCTIHYSDGSTTVGTGSNLAKYTKVGRLVTVTGYLNPVNLSSLTGSVEMRITGFPFASTMDSTFPYFTRFLDAPTNTCNTVGYLANGRTYAVFYFMTDDGAYSSAAVNLFHNTNNDLYFAVTYQAT